MRKKLRIDLKWREMRSKVIFGHLKWPLAAILWEKKAYWYEMARNAIESDFRSSKMATDNHIIKKIIIIVAYCHFVKTKVAYWSETIESDFRSFKMAQIGLGHLNFFLKCCILPFCEKKKAYWSDMARNAIEKWFSVIENAAILIDLQPFCEFKKKKRSKVIFVHPKWPPAAIFWTKFKTKSWGGGGGI